MTKKVKAQIERLEKEVSDLRAKQSQVDTLVDALEEVLWERIKGRVDEVVNEEVSLQVDDLQISR